MAPPPAGALRPQREGAARAHARPPALRPRALARPHHPRPGEARRPPRRPAGAAPAHAALRLPAPGVLPRPRAGRARRGGGDAPSELAPRGRVRAAGAPRRGVLRDERGRAPLRPSGDGALRLRAPPRPRPASPLRRLLLRRRPALVGGPRARVARPGPLGLRLLQQRRRRQRREKRRPPAALSGGLRSRSGRLMKSTTEAQRPSVPRWWILTWHPGHMQPNGGSRCLYIPETGPNKDAVYPLPL